MNTSVVAEMKDKYIDALTDAKDRDYFQNIVKEPDDELLADYSTEHARPIGVVYQGHGWATMLARTTKHRDHEKSYFLVIVGGSNGIDQERSVHRYRSADLDEWKFKTLEQCVKMLQSHSCFTTFTGFTWAVGDMIGVY